MVMGKQWNDRWLQNVTDAAEQNRQCGPAADLHYDKLGIDQRCLSQAEETFATVELWVKPHTLYRLMLSEIHWVQPETSCSALMEFALTNIWKLRLM